MNFLQALLERNKSLKDEIHNLKASKPPSRAASTSSLLSATVRLYLDFFLVACGDLTGIEFLDTVSNYSDQGYQF